MGEGTKPKQTELNTKKMDKIASLTTEISERKPVGVFHLFVFAKHCQYLYKDKSVWEAAGLLTSLHTFPINSSLQGALASQKNQVNKRKKECCRSTATRIRNTVS